MSFFEEDDEDELPPFNSLSEQEKEEFYEYITTQMGLVMDTAEKHNVLFEMITEWPRDKQLAFAMSTVLQNKILDDDKDN